jgi:DNA-binding NtrC family response regulator
MYPLLIVEDEPVEAELIGSALREADYRFDLAGSVKEAQEKLLKNRYALAFVDYQLPDGTGNQVLKWSQTLKEQPVFFLMSAFGTIPRAVEAVKLGARDFLEKPLDKDQLLRTVKEFVQSPQKDSRDILNSAGLHGIIFAKGSPLEDSMELAALVADKVCNVLVSGESGTGKEIFARLIHRLGPRSARSFIGVNCSAIPDTLFESELFGYQKGSFTGASRDFPGRISQANGGTLFLDEVGDIPMHFQTKLLRVLQEKTVAPIGSQKEVPVDFRLICATHKNLDQAVRNGLFREDLYYRINVIKIPIPPLRERPGDIPCLIRHFYSEYSQGRGRDDELDDLPEYVQTHSWPGNVRELKNAVERYTVMRDMGKSWKDILSGDGSSSRTTAGTEGTGSGAVKIHRRGSAKYTDEEILQALESCGYHREKTAGFLGISRRTLQYRISEMKKK